jgi:hypothetical protein
MQRLLPFLFLVLLLTACGDDDARRWTGSIEPLPGGGVRVMNPAHGMWADAEGWRLVPELRLGDLDGPPATTFGTLIALEVGEDGRIYALDRQANELRIFAPDGTHLRTVGRAGEGPGEYRNANGLLWLARDSLLVIDQAGARYSVLTADGDYVRSVRRALPFWGWVFSGWLIGDRVYERFAVGATPETSVPAVLGTAVRGEPAAAEDVLLTADEIRSAPGAAGVDTLLLPPPAGPRVEPFSVRGERGGMMMSVPFAPGAVYHVDAEETLWHGHGGEFRIVRSSLAGDTLLEIVLDAAATPVAAEELAEWETQPSVARFREMGGRLDMSRIPRTKPYFDGFYRDPDGHLWVSVPGPPRHTIFTIFDGDGRHLGRLEMRGIVRDVFVPPVVRNGRLHLVGRDELDVPGVYVYRLER